MSIAITYRSVIIIKACVHANFLPSVYQCVLLVSFWPLTSTMFLYTKRFCDAICSCILMLSGLYLPVEIFLPSSLSITNIIYFMAGRDLKSSLYERMWLTNEQSEIYIYLSVYIYIYISDQLNKWFAGEKLVYRLEESNQIYEGEKIIIFFYYYFFFFGEISVFIIFLGIIIFSLFTKYFLSFIFLILYDF